MSVASTTDIAPSRTVRLAMPRGTLVALIALVAALAALVVVNPSPLSYFDISTISASATTLALAAIGQTIVIVGGGLDLSAGAVISLVNVVLVTQLGPAPLNTPLYTLAATAIALGLGAGIGAVNGVLIGYLRLQSIVVTLATMFVAQGAALLILKSPGGEVSYDFSTLLVGDLVTELVPMPLVIIGLGLLAWVHGRRHARLAPPARSPPATPSA